MSALPKSAVPLLDLQAQYPPIRTEIMEAIGRVVESQRFILGEEVEGFEQEIASYCQTRHAIGCASGSGGRAAGIRAEDAVFGAAGMRADDCVRGGVTPSSDAVKRAVWLKVSVSNR